MGFFVYKFKASILWEYYLLSMNLKVGKAALKNYLKAKNAWKIAGDISKKYYLPDLSYGPQTWLRGRWDDRLPAIIEDINDMKNIIKKNTQSYKIIKKDLQFINFIQNWNNYQNVKVKNETPKKFSKGKKIKISCKLDIRKNLKGYLHYREVDQSKQWKRKKMGNISGNYNALISNIFSNTDYPIQYYFEFEDKNHSYFSPGFNKFLSNQPYYLLRQIK